MKVSLGGTVTVSATERWFSEIRAGRGFGLHQTVAASVGNFSEGQLFNPVGSGITVICFSLVSALSAAGILEMRRHIAALATLSSQGLNLLFSLGPLNSIAEVRLANPAAKSGTQFMQRDVLAATAVDMLEGWWICELPPGHGVHVASPAVNQTIRNAWRWIEI